MNRFVNTALAAAVVLCAAAGCQSQSPAVQKHMPVAEVPFTPARTAAQGEWHEGAYPNLFAPASYAVWGGLPADGDSDTAPKGPLVVDVYLASAFADMSVAYDVVGMRGIHTYLDMPNGDTVRPAQVVVGSELEEEMRGALRMFVRKNRLIFPMAADEVMVPARPDAAVALVLEGHGTIYKFVWPAQLPDAETYAPGGGAKARAHIKAGKDSAQKGWGKVRDFSHNFD